MSASTPRPKPVVDPDGVAHSGQHPATRVEGVTLSECGWCVTYARRHDAWSASQIDWSRFA